MNNNNKIGAFTRMCCTIGNLPSSYMMSMSYEEQLLWLCNYLEKTIIPAVNGNAQAVEELQAQFNLLKSYVDNYFDNLDIQTEIDNKLDEMADSGELTDIIAQYLQLAGILAFNTLNDLKGAENLANGSFTRIYGKLTYNDGLGAFYKIRTILNTDVIDNDNIIALTNYPTLVGEKIKDKRIDDIEDTLSFELTGRTILLGDSYGSARNGVEGWCARLQTKLGLSNDDCYKYTTGGGFVATTTFQQLLQSHLTDIQHPETIKNIIVVGGDNDNSATYSDIQTAIGNFETYVKTNFPNAQIYLGFFLYCDENHRNSFINGMENTLPAYSNLENCNNIIYLNNLEYAVRDKSCLQADGIHLAEAGQKQLTQAIYNCFKNGSCTNNRRIKNFTLTLTNTPESGSQSGYMPYVQRNTDNCIIGINSLQYDFDTNPYSINFGQNDPTLDYATWENDEYVGMFSSWLRIPITIRMHTNKGSVMKNALVQFAENKHVYIYFCNDEALGEVSIDRIVLGSNSITASSRQC